MAISDTIARTLIRLGAVAEMLSGESFRSLYRGLSKEFSRVSDLKDIVLCASVPNINLCTESLDDLENKYGLASGVDYTDQERINRIIERASLDGAGGKDWLEAQIQAAGFPLYVIENLSQIPIETQFGSVQFDETTQFGTMPKRTDPNTVDGILITSSANRRGGAKLSVLSQFGSAQFGSSYFGTIDPDYTYPQPAERTLPTDTTKWSRIFFLSPFPDRLAAPSEMLFLSSEKINYLIKLVTQIKYLRNWCIAQVAENVVLTMEDDSGILSEDELFVIRG